MMAMWEVATKVGQWGRIHQTSSWMNGGGEEWGSLLLSCCTLAFLSHLPPPKSMPRQVCSPRAFPIAAANTQNPAALAPTPTFFGSLLLAPHHVCFGSTSSWLYIRDASIIHPLLILQMVITWSRPALCGAWGSSKHPRVSVLLQSYLPRTYW